MTSDNQTDNLNACADIVHKGDPDRFRATMAAPLALREKLLPLYAFNVEVARAPWVTKESVIAEMRLQWWHDALGEIAAGGKVRRHEVVSPLSKLLTPLDAARLQSVVKARRWDIYKDRFEDEQALWSHLSATSRNLTQVALHFAGDHSSPLIDRYSDAAGLAGWFTAAAALKASGRSPLPDEDPNAIAALAESGLLKCKHLKKNAPSKTVRTVLLAGWQTVPILKRAIKEPQRVLDGSLALSAPYARLRLASKVALSSF